MDKTSIETNDIITGVKVVTHEYVESDESEQLYEGVVNGTIELTFTEPYHTYSITGGSIIEFGTNYVIIKGENSVVLSAKKYTHSETVYTKENPQLIKNKKYAEVKNVSIVNLSNVDEILNRVYNWYVGKVNVKCDLLVGEHELSECVSVPTFDGIKSGTITSMDYTFTNEMRARVVVE